MSGISLLGKVLEHNLDILKGKGRSGKGVYYATMVFALGDYAGIPDPDIFMDKKGAHPTGDMSLLGLRLAVVSESGRNQALNEARMKRFTGGDDITARYVHQNLVTFTPTHTAMFVTNYLPKVSGDDEAVWARLRVIPFDVVIPPAERDKHLGDKLQAEAEVVLAWAVEGWLDYRRRGDFLDEPEAVLQRTAKYRSDSDDLGRFIEEWCDLGPAYCAMTSELHEAYTRWANQSGAQSMRMVAFANALTERGFEGGKHTKKGRPRPGIMVEDECTKDAEDTADYWADR